MNETKPWYTSKTLWFNVIMTILDVLAVLQGSALLENQPEVLAGLSALHGAGNVALRFVTTKPIGK